MLRNARDSSVQRADQRDGLPRPGRMNCEETQPVTSYIVKRRRTEIRLGQRTFMDHACRRFKANFETRLADAPAPVGFFPIHKIAWVEQSSAPSGRAGHENTAAVNKVYRASRVLLFIQQAGTD